MSKHVRFDFDSFYSIIVLGAILFYTLVVPSIIDGIFQ